jgi:hypothetical protein
MDVIKLYIDKSVKGFSGSENPYTHDFIKEVFNTLDELNPNDFRDRLINRHKYAEAASLLSWVKKDRLQFTMFGIIQNIELKQHKQNRNFRKKICNHVAFPLFN